MNTTERTTTTSNSTTDGTESRWQRFLRRTVEGLGSAAMLDATTGYWYPVTVPPPQGGVAR